MFSTAHRVNKLRPVTKYNFESMVIRRSPIFGDVIVAWKVLDQIDYEIWKREPNMVCPAEGIRFETLGM